MAIGKSIAVQFTKEEHATIKAKAEKKAMSLTDHVRSVLLKDAAK